MSASPRTSATIQSDVDEHETASLLKGSSSTVRGELHDVPFEKEQGARGGQTGLRSSKDPGGLYSPLSVGTRTRVVDHWPTRSLACPELMARPLA